MLWRAEGATSGVGRGPLRRVSTLEEASQFQCGEVLVVRTPDPVWSMLYPLAAGLVAETGGLLSHGVVAAREIGLPAAIGADGVYAGVANGTVMEVDGTTGHVRVGEA